jgi:hypothetical protein
MRDPDHTEAIEEKVRRWKREEAQRERKESLAKRLKRTFETVWLAVLLVAIAATVVALAYALSPRGASIAWYWYPVLWGLLGVLVLPLERTEWFIKNVAYQPQLWLMCFTLAVLSPFFSLGRRLIGWLIS